MIPGLEYEIDLCKICELHNGLSNGVGGIGNKSPRIMLIGEAPGEWEQKEKKPFVGPAGQALQEILLDLNLQLSDLYLTNVVKHRPPQNRKPLVGERRGCAEKFLKYEIDYVDPAIIVCLGRTAVEALHELQEKPFPKGSLRGIRFYYNEFPTIATWHPSYLIRQTSQEDFTRVRGDIIEDFQAALACYEASNGNSQERQPAQ